MSISYWIKFQLFWPVSVCTGWILLFRPKHVYRSGICIHVILVIILYIEGQNCHFCPFLLLSLPDIVESLVLKTSKISFLSVLTLPQSSIPEWIIVFFFINLHINFFKHFIMHFIRTSQLVTREKFYKYSCLAKARTSGEFIPWPTVQGHLAPSPKGSNQQ